MSGTPPMFSNAGSNDAGRVALTARHRTNAVPLLRLRRWLFFLTCAITTLLGLMMMFDILRVTGVTGLEIVILGLFTVTFGWIAIAFWTAVIGFLLQALRRDPLSLRPLPATDQDNRPIVARTALVMPAYNEDTDRVVGGLETMVRSLEQLGLARQFDAYLLSDTNDPVIAERERAAWAALYRRLGHVTGLYYRRRTVNTGRKAGNIADFCRRWGEHYDYMVVLDADSLMSGETLIRLVRAMQAEPNVGLIQTVPIPVRQTTLFGRLMQFAAALYSPMLATGQSFWQADTANYWGHNAILRVRAFTDHCGLPTLPGRPPLGGEILSHDFVEAALLRRAGWQVHLLPAIEASHEELPGNALDYAKRDRRWTQGNLQHLRLLTARGLHPLSRLHFLLGATAYIASLLWLLMLLVSTIDAVIRAATADRFFGDGYQLFPNWPIAKTGMIVSLLCITLALLLLPKLLGLILALLRRSPAFGGPARLLASAFLETVFAVLLAPLMMLYHSYFVLGVLCGRNVTWGPQAREGRVLHWREIWRHTYDAVLIGLGWAALTLYYTPSFFWWLTPIFAGLLLAPLLVRWTSSPTAGRWSRRIGLFLVPSEIEPIPELRALDRQATVEPDSSTPELPPLPPERPRLMPVQQLDRNEYVTSAATSP